MKKQEEAIHSMNRHIAFFLPSLGGGGAEKAMLKLANIFAKNGFRVDLVLAHAKGPYLNQVPSEIQVVDLHVSRVAWALLPLTRYIRQHRPYALISALSHANIIAILAAKLSRAPIKVLVSERTTLSQSLRYPVNLREKYIPFIMKLFYPLADQVIAVSEGGANDLSRILHIPRSRIKVIYNPTITDDLFEQANQEVDHPWFKSRQYPIVLAVGRLTEAKDYPTLIRAFYRVRQEVESKLVILGEGEKRTELMHFIQEMGLVQDVDIVGFVQNPYPYMKQCSVFVLSSKFEGLPNALIEALACGAKIVATDCPSGPREILRNGQYGALVKVGDEQAMAAQILKKLLEKENGQLPKEAYMPFYDQTVYQQYVECIFPEVVRPEA